MLKEVTVVKAGYERVVDVLNESIATLEEAKAKEIAEVVAPIEEKYAQRLKDYKEDLARFVHIETVEEPDEEEHVEETGEEVAY